MTRSVWDRLGRRVKLARRRAVDIPSTLEHLRELRTLLDQLYDAELVRGRELGYPLAALGPSKQAAYERHKAALGRAERGLTREFPAAVQDDLLYL